MKRLLTISIILWSYLGVMGQDQAAFTVHYNAYNLFHPGIEIGYQLPLFSKTVINKKENKRWYQVDLHPNMATYYHWNNHTGLLLGSDLQLKTISNGGFEFQVFGGGHYLRTILGNPTFKQVANGSFEEVKFAGGNYFHWRAGFGFGLNLIPKYDKPYAFNIKAGVTQPNLPGSPIIPNLWLGVNYYFNYKN